MGRQVAQHADFALAERFERRLRPGGQPRGRPSGQQADDLGDQGGVGGALPELALDQVRRRVQQERQQPAVRFGKVECALEGAPGSAGIPKRVLGDRLTHESMNQPGRPAQGNGAVQYRCERGGRRARIAAGEPQPRSGHAHLPAVAVVKAGEDLLSPFGLAEMAECVQKVCVRRRDK
jgi:hypothetical protein